ncbi:hypothetical protein ABIE67_004871 [Streptomyces sp. V4I8]|uniref:hypothetical protein n=1 Tax=Streptomyces sp. V4I8 TaxID=3156469 RepID=UPI00351874F1
MRTTPSLRIMAAALLTGGALAVATTGTTAAASDRDNSPIGIECQVLDHHANGDPFWYWLSGDQCREGNVSVSVIVIVAV